MRINPTLFLAAVALLLASCDKDSSTPTTQKTKGPRIAFVTNGVADFWTIAQKGAKDAAPKYDVDVTVIMPEPSQASVQKQRIEDLLIRGVDGIAISPIDAVNQASFINDTAAKTKLITHDSDAPTTKRLVYIGMDNYTAGRMVGQLVREALPSGGKVAILVGRLDQDNAKYRRQGVVDEIMGRSVDRNRVEAADQPIKNDKYNIVGTYTDGFDFTKAKANAEAVMNLHPDLAAMVGLFEYNPPLILEAVAQAGKLRKVQVIGFDEADRTLQAIKDGTCFATVVQNPYMYGHDSVRVLASLIRGDNSIIPANGFIEFPARVIRKETVQDFWEDKNKKLGKAPPAP